MDGLILLRPLWLIGLLPLAGLVALILLRIPDAGGWQQVMPRDMLRAMQALGALTGRQRPWQLLLAPAGLAALVLGLDFCVSHTCHRLLFTHHQPSFSHLEETDPVPRSLRSADALSCSLFNRNGL